MNWTGNAALKLNLQFQELKGQTAYGWERFRIIPTKEGIYWYGLKADGSAAFEFDNFHDFFRARIFNGKSLKDVWSQIEWLSIDGCSPEDRI